MNRMKRAALLTELADKLRDQGSWCGETHVQKAMYFLQVLLEVPAGFQFILYKHGPYAFDQGDELTALEADGLMELRPQPAPYGPSLVTTPRSVEFRQRYPITLGKYAAQIAFIARTLGKKGVAELERLATALYVSREPGAASSVEERAQRLNALKPHVSLAQAREAVQELDRIAAAAKSLNTEKTHV